MHTVLQPSSMAARAPETPAETAVWHRHAATRLAVGLSVAPTSPPLDEEGADRSFESYEGSADRMQSVAVID